MFVAHNKDFQSRYATHKLFQLGSWLKIYGSVVRSQSNDWKKVPFAQPSPEQNEICYCEVIILMKKIWSYGFNHLLMQVANDHYFYLVKQSSLPANELYFTK